MKNVKVEFTEKNLTGNAGLVHVGRFAKKLGLRQLLEESLTIERGANAWYQAVDVAIMVIFGVLAGAKHVSQLIFLRVDGVIRKIFSWEHFPDNV